jgi:hypothetical protein
MIHEVHVLVFSLDAAAAEQPPWRQLAHQALI